MLDVSTTVEKRGEYLTNPFITRRARMETNQNKHATSEALDFGIDSCGDLPRDDASNVASNAQALRATVDEAALAEQLGTRAYPVGGRALS